jgi:hypothetical protein
MNVLWLPIFSMRSYDTGMYSILKDGNFQLTLSRILASDFDSITVAYPTDSSDFEEFEQRVADLANGRNIYFQPMHYGANAVETREKFWTLNYDFFYSELILDYDLLITDITGYAGTMSYDIPFINNFNITKLPELDRPYIDKFFETDIKNIEAEASLFTTVINPRQREYILQVAPHLKDKVVAYTKVAHYDLMPTGDHKTRVFDTAFSMRTIFWPFRISDKAYKWDQFLEMFIENKLDKRYKIVITDPNDSYKGDHKFVKKVKMTKDEYYEYLLKKPIIVMLDEIDTVLHPGTIEFFFYGCNVITLLNELVGNEHQVESISQIPQKLNELGYNSPTNTRDFVYWPKEVSEHYNKNNIEQCVQNS